MEATDGNRLERPKIYWAFVDSWTLIKRSSLYIIKSPDQLMSAVATPIMFMLLFRYVFGGAINTGDTSYINYLTAGIIVQTAAFGSTYTAIGVATDFTRGIVDRFKSLPMISSAVLVGHTVADLARNGVSLIIMILMGLLVGFRPEASAMDWLLIALVLLLFSFAISWVMACLAMFAKSPEAVNWIGFIVIMPLTFASSAFVPTDGMVTPLRIFAENQPVTITIDAVRNLSIGQPVGNDAWLSIAWSVGVLLLMIPLASYLFRHNSVRS